jgi:hypothetical protein
MLDTRQKFKCRMGHDGNCLRVCVVEEKCIVSGERIPPDRWPKTMQTKQDPVR